MKTRHIITFIIILLLSLGVVLSSALAAEKPPRLDGKITAVDAGAATITVQPREGDPVTVQTSEDTKFFRKISPKNHVAITFDDLAIDDLLLVLGEWENETFNASRVIVLPPPPAKLVGVITALDPDAGTITLQPKEGDPVTVQTGENTKYFQIQRQGKPLLITFDDLVVGDKIVVLGYRDGEVFNATKVVVLLPPLPKPISGVIQALDPEAGTLTVNLKDKDPLTIQTTEETKYFRRTPTGQEEISFDDLALQDRVIVWVTRDGETIIAHKVLVIPPPPPKPVGGIITALDTDTATLTVKPLNKDPLTIQTTEETKFFRAVNGSQVEITFDDLALRDRVIVWVTRNGETITAHKVLVVPTPPKNIAGVIQSIDPDEGSFVLKPGDHDPLTVQTGEDTKFFRKIPGGHEAITFANLQVDDHAIVIGTWDGDVFRAQKVILVPPPPKMIVGIITDLDAGAGTIIVQPEEGDLVTVQTYEETKYFRVPRQGEPVPITFDDLALDDKVSVQGYVEGEVFKAVKVLVLPEPTDDPPQPPEDNRLIGTITALDAGAGTITVQPTAGDAVVAQTSGETKYFRQVRKGEHEVITFDDLALEDKVIILGVLDGDTFNATKVIVMTDPMPPKEND
jgi:outer membrane protein assembly factor BamB